MSEADAAMIRAVDLRVDYGGFTAVQELSFEVGAGEVFGLIGPNGAGKSSTIKVLATLREPSFGEAFVAGMDCVERAREVRSVLGYMPDFAPVYDDLEAWEMLDMFAAAHGVGGGDSRRRRARVDEALERVGLTAKRKARAGTLSRGMKQRLVLAKTMLHEPRVLLLDEPASGLDPRARIEMRNVLRALAAEGRTVLVSSHILTELADLCTSIGIMDRGRMVVCGRIDEIVSRMQPHRTLVVELVAADEAAAGQLEVLCPGRTVKVEAPTRLIIESFEGDDDAVAEVLAGLVARKVRVRAFYDRKLDVEDVFMAIGAEGDGT